MAERHDEICSIFRCTPNSGTTCIARYMSAIIRVFAYTLGVCMYILSMVYRLVELASTITFGTQRAEIIAMCVNWSFGTGFGQLPSI